MNLLLSELVWLSHELLILRLNVYEFNIIALALYGYLKRRRQRNKMNQDYSSWEKGIFELPQRSILGPNLFDLYLSNLFLVLNTRIASYADNRTIYDSDKNINELIKWSKPRRHRT